MRPDPRGQRPRFLVESDDLTIGGLVDFDAEEGRHARVLRLLPGAPVEIFDGRGRTFLGCVDDVGRNAVRTRVEVELPRNRGESPLELTLAVAALKADKLDWVIEKATELGVTALRVFESRFSLGRPSPNRRERWRQIARSAAKQCRRSVVPAVESAEDLDAVLRIPAERKLFLWERAPAEAENSPAARSAPRSALVVVGPEGGFSADEAERARAESAMIVRFGPRILRAETAAVAATAWCQARWGDLESGEA